MLYDKLHKPPTRHSVDARGRALCWWALDEKRTDAHEAMAQAVEDAQGAPLDAAKAAKLGKRITAAEKACASVEAEVSTLDTLGGPSAPCDACAAILRKHPQLANQLRRAS